MQTDKISTIKKMERSWVLLDVDQIEVVKLHGMEQVESSCSRYQKLAVFVWSVARCTCFKHIFLGAVLCLSGNINK